MSVSLSSIIIVDVILYDDLDTSRNQKRRTVWGRRNVLPLFLERLEGRTLLNGPATGSLFLQLGGGVGVKPSVRLAGGGQETRVQRESPPFQGRGRLLTLARLIG
jgi:hypothetical protein